MSRHTQIALDFGEEPQSPPPAATADGNSGVVAEPVRPYMAAGGVGVRVKSFKQPAPAPAEKTAPPVLPQNGSLFGDTAASEQETNGKGIDPPAISTVLKVGEPETVVEMEPEEIAAVEGEPVVEEVMPAVE